MNHTQKLRNVPQCSALCLFAEKENLLKVFLYIYRTKWMNFFYVLTSICPVPYYIKALIPIAKRDRKNHMTMSLVSWLNYQDSKKGGVVYVYFSCVKIQKITNMLTLGQMKLYMGLWTRIQSKILQILIFENAKLDCYTSNFFLQKYDFAYWKIKNFQYFLRFLVHRVHTQLYLTQD